MNKLAFTSLAAVALVVTACSAATSGDAESSNQDITQGPQGAPAAPNAAPAPASPATPPAAPALPDNVQWFRNSAEAHAGYLQAFRLATLNVDAALAAPAAPESGSWAVITDADETLLNNSQYQKDRGAQGWSADSWSAWVQSKQSTATPGSIAYVNHVHDVGGHVFVVTNGAQADCPAYTSHIQDLGFKVDGVLCQTDSSDKNPRFQKVQDGTAVPGIGAQKVLLWTGDNILDFPSESQASRSDESQLTDFGSRFVVLPNPMYGSWTSNPRN